MTAFLDIRDNGIRQIVEEYFKETRLASCALLGELRAVTQLQSWWRGIRCRRYLHYLSRQALKIQRLYRGNRGRARALLEFEARQQLVRSYLYNEVAVLIQKTYRGHKSRKTLIDFYARKKYIDAVEKKGQELRATLNKDCEDRKKEAKERDEMTAAEQFTAITSNLHHLLSTARQPGIFKSPYGEVFSAKAFDIPVEEHIADAFKALREKQKKRPNMNKISRQNPGLRQTNKKC